MESIDHLYPWLELMDRPAFCVKGGVITAVNASAECRMLRVGMPVNEIVTEHRNIYDTFQNGSMHLVIQAGGIPCKASVSRTEEFDLFVIYQDSDSEQLQALSLAAQQLRIPLSNVMTITDQLLATLNETDPASLQQANQINHGLFQLLRIISNMSDADRYQNMSNIRMASVDFTSLFAEILEKAEGLISKTDIHLHYHGPEYSVFGIANAEQIERAIYNLLSNAIKFSAAGTTVAVSLAKSENSVVFTVCNQHSEDSESWEFWNRYRRTPTIEDSRYGLGLGMTLVRSAAFAHGGTVLIDHPTSTQTRVTFTIPIVSDNSTTVSTPIISIGDYAGGRDKGLLEFSEILPTSSYQKIN